MKHSRSIQRHETVLISDDPSSNEIIKPYLRGQDIGRWSPQWAGLWMIFVRRGTDVSMITQRLENT